MSIEASVVDTNILIYALDADAPQYRASRALLEAAQVEGAPFYVTSQILCEFYSIVTNPRRVARPRTSAEALDAISSLLTFLRVLPVPESAVEGWMNLIRERSVIGADVFDLQLVATMQANGIARIYTFNKEDFQPFESLTVIEPNSV